MSSPLSDTIPLPPRSALSSIAAAVARPQESRARRVLGFCLHLILFAVPLVFYPGQWQMLELVKQMFFLCILVIALGAAAWMVVEERQLSWSKNWLHLVPVTVVLGYVLLATQSVDPLSSFFGTSSQTAWSVLSLVGGLLFYGLLVLHIQSTGHIYRLLLTTFLSSSLLACFALVPLFVTALFPSVLGAWQGWTPLGSIYSLAFFLVSTGLTSFVLLHQVCQGKACPFTQHTPVTRSCVLIARVAGGISLLTIGLLSLRSLWIVTLCALLVVVGWELFHVRRQQMALIPWVWLGAAMIVSCFFIFVRVPFHPGVPPEVSPNIAASWLIARQTLHDHPLVGVGAGNWVAAYTRYRPVEINTYPFWEVRFDRGYSSALTLLTTGGILGSLLILLFLAAFLYRVGSYFVQKQAEPVWWTSLIVFAGWLGVTGVFFTYNFTFAHQMMWWFFSALLVVLTASSRATWVLPRASHIARIVRGASLVLGSLCVGLIGYRVVCAGMYARVMDRTRNGVADINQTISALESLHRMAGWNEVYASALAEAYMQNVLRIMQQKPTQEQFIQVRNSVTAAIYLLRESHERHPLHSDTLFELGFLYQRVAPFTPGAYEQALEEYKKMRVLDPANPRIPYEMGRVLLQQAENDRIGTQVTDEVKKKQAQTTWNNRLQFAVQSFQESLRMKSDYFPAHYQLGVAYERQGHIPEAIQEVERALRGNTRDAGLAFELALLYQRAGDPSAAKNLLEQVVQAEPKNMNAHWYLSVVDEEKGEIDQAIVQIEILLQDETLKNSQVVQQRLSHLQALRASKLAPSVHALPDPLVSTTPLPQPSR